MHVSAFSRRGIGKPHNEDALCVTGEILQGSVCKEWQLPPSQPILVAVADGVAIGTSPRRASRELLRLLVQSGLAEISEVQVATMLRLVQDQYASLAEHNPVVMGMASTLVGVILHDRHCTVFNVGDSRAYVLDASGGIGQLSHDHTQIQEMIDAGEVTIEQARNAASIYDQLTSHFLAEPDFQEFRVHVTQHDLQEGERLILASDGVFEALQNLEIAKLLHQCTPDTLLSTYRTARECGGTDDFTIACIY